MRITVIKIYLQKFNTILKAYINIDEEIKINDIIIKIIKFPILIGKDLNIEYYKEIFLYLIKKHNNLH